MNAPVTDAALDPLLAEALDWVSRMGSGSFSAADRAAFARWRAIGPDHDAAFRQAAALGSVLRQISAEIVEEETGRSRVVPFRSHRPDRRALLVGAMAASVAGVIAIGSPGLRSLFGRRADFATSTGERRTISLAPGLTLDLDAQTSIAVDGRRAGGHRIALLGGRAAVDARLDPANPVEVVAGKGRVLADRARFDVEADGARSCVTCVSGAVMVAYADRRLPIGARQQIVYDDDGIGAARQVDADEATAWTTGQLIFHRTPLSDVVVQLNRYRPGKVVIVNHDLSSRPVNGVFHVGQINDAIPQIEQITGARATHLPGGLVVFS